ncbi:TetR family transcriptional regulator [Gordoniibacillus kamchatkensis]|uniref:TetR family transcriptional regulator n=1 Tax=Gordoniibacillus kamchatkensis TaxID=1590651 RepID=A0ABR5ACM1_9BACL|nr:TetR/AcrR family transcriptional regulator [Paenibacillus sp. VKM B-2647]KIL38747.1 TetR family transcriptional regulator [Paenibacillus sp. VKM B-2647]
MKNADRRKQTTRQLLDAAKELLQEKSCHAITMKDITERSKLSKGAIFHYVRSKDEIFAWVLQEQLEEMNDQFMNEVNRPQKSFEGPMQTIADNLQTLGDAHNVTNKVLVYLLGKEDEPGVAEVLRHFYERAVQFSRQWISIGQRHGVIRESVDPDKTAEMFVLLSLGLRVRSSLQIGASLFTAQDLASFMSGMLKKT